MRLKVGDRRELVKPVTFEGETERRGENRRKRRNGRELRFRRRDYEEEEERMGE